MKTTILPLIAAILLSCNSEVQEHKVNETESKTEKQTGQVYCNEHGSVNLISVDTNYRVVFSKNDSIVFDTIFRPALKNGIFEKSVTKGKTVIQLKYSFLIFDEYTLSVQDISSVAYMPMYTGITDMYTRPFFRCDTTTKISGILNFGKGQPTINGIYLDQRIVAENNDSLSLEGTISREKFPRDFYSTPESPQGMFGDTTVDHYRLVLKNCTIID